MRTVLLTLLLLFVVLCYVYPLKFLYAVSLGGGISDQDLISVRVQLAVAAVGLLSAALVWLPAPGGFYAAGFVYALNAVVYSVAGRRGRALRGSA